jgi:ATP-dependent Clp protease ATP-binding subunit ClpC
VFERFTERARQVPVLAQDEARSLGHNYIGTEHLLIGLLREEDGLAARVLQTLGVTLDEVRERVVAIVERGEERPVGQMPFTPRAKKVLELSLREALSMGHNHIGTEHILLGLVHEGSGVAARILSDMGVDAEAIRREVVTVLGGPDPPGPGWTGYAPGPGRRWPRRRLRGLAIAREEALEEGNYDLARKLLELDIEDRQKRDEPKADDV